MFIPGQVYVRKEIHKQYGGQVQGGISTPSKYPVIFIFSGENGLDYGYKDEWINNDTFIYTGEGQIGDMKFVRGNKSIRDHKYNNKAIYLFKSLGNGKVQFVCEVEYVRYKIEQGFDLHRDIRKIIRFELKKSV